MICPWPHGYCQITQPPLYFHITYWSFIQHLWVFCSFQVGGVKLGRLLWKSTTSWSQSLQNSEIEETLKTHFSALLSAPGSWSHPKMCITSASMPSGFHLGLPIKDNSRKWKAETKFYSCCFSALARWCCQWLQAPILLLHWATWTALSSFATAGLMVRPSPCCQFLGDSTTLADFPQSCPHLWK